MVRLPAATKEAPERVRAPWSWWVWAGCGVVAAVTMGFYAWTAQSPVSRFSFEKGGAGYYNMLAEGFLAGHLTMNAQPDPALLKLADPYDPEQSAPRLHDASFYKGKYYLYFGASPALVWFVPWRLLTGLPVSENFADVVYCSAGFLIWAGLALRIMRRHFPSAGGGFAIAAVLILGLGNMCPVLLRRAAFWEVPIAGAYFFNALCVTFAYLALTSRRRAHLYLALSGVGLGFAVGARPGFVFLSIGLGLLGLWFAKPRQAGERWVSWRSVGWIVAAVAPFSLCLLALLAYNYFRFDNPFEFGTTYQLAGHNMHTWKMLDWSNVPINVYHYFLSRAQFSVYFPFVEVIGSPPFRGPKNYYGVENVYGVLPNLPVVLLAVGAFGLWFRNRTLDRGTLKVFVVSLTFAFLACLPVLLQYAAAASRYMVDMVPWQLMLALIGILLGESILAGRVVWRRLFRVFWVVLAGWTVLFNVLVSFQHNDLLRLNNPPVFARFARVFNRVSPVLEKLTGDAHGPIELKLHFPTDRMGKLEPLVVSGLSFKADFVYLYYTDSTHVQIGFEHTGYGGGISQPIFVDYAAEQTIRIEMGSLYPPETHPYFKGKANSEILELKRRLKLWVNGVPYLDFNALFYESSPKDVVVGRDPIFSAFGKQFTGSITSIRRVQDEPTAGISSGYGAVRLAVQFPVGKIGVSEPLVVTGVAGRGDLFYVTYLDAKTVRLTIDHWGVGDLKSPPIDVNYEHIHVFEIDLGSMHPPPPGTIPKVGFPSRYEIKMDGAIIMQGSTQFHPSQPGEIYLALNPIGGSTASANFSGRVIVKEPLEK